MSIERGGKVPRRLNRLWFAAAAVSAVAGGCASDPEKGYSFASPWGAEVQTVAVPMFANTTFSRGLEVQLTDALIKEIQSTTPWRVVAAGSDGSGGAQATLTGSIKSAELDKLSTGRTSGLVQELAFTIAVDFEFKDNRTGKVVVTRKNFTASESFVPALGVNEPIEVGQHAAVQEMARDIVGELRSSW